MDQIPYEAIKELAAYIEEDWYYAGERGEHIVSHLRKVQRWLEQQRNSAA